MNMRMKIEASDRDVALLAAIEDGLPICEKPFEVIGKELAMGESEVIERLERLQNMGIIRRFGLVLQHRPLGYRANAMVVWDIPDDEVNEVAKAIAAHDFVTLCYCRARCKPVWPYNLYCMIHGRERTRVEEQIDRLKKQVGLEAYPGKTLFSRRRFKQTGARFSSSVQGKKVVK